MDEDLSDIDLDQLISEVKQGKNDSLNEFMDSRWLAKLLNQVSVKVAGEFKGKAGNAIHIRGELFYKLFINIRTIENLNIYTLRGWCYTTARNICLNEIRHIGVVNRHSEQVIHEQTRGKRISAGGETIILPVSASKSPEEIVLSIEIDDLASKILDIIATFPPHEKYILIRWAKGSTLRESSEATGISVPTVHRRLKHLQRLIMERIQQLVEADLEMTKGVYAVVADRLQEMEPLGNFPPKAA